MSEGEKYRWYVLATVFVGTFMGPLDSSIVNIAIPSLSRDFSVGITTIEWVVTAYLLTTSVLLLSAGRLGDMKGHKRIYIAGFAVFTASSALCGLSSGIDQLIFFRVLQALGATCMLATGPAILTDTYPASQRGRALGMVAVSVALGLTVGPFLGGFIVGHLGWRWIFFVNVPVGIIASLLAASILKEGKREVGKRFDFAGSSLALASLLAVLLALSMGNEWGWRSPRIFGLFAAAAISAFSFIAVENRVGDPVLDLSLFKNRLFSAANASALINYIALFVVMFLMPFYLGYVFRASTQLTGIVLTAVPLATAIVAPVSGALSDRIGSRFLSTAGLVVTALALLGLSRTSPGGGLWQVAVLLAIVGFGSGMFQSPNTSAIMGSVPRNRLGVASGLQATMRNIGMVLGVALSGAIVATFAPRGELDPSYASAIRVAFATGAFVAAFGAVLSLVRGPARGAARLNVLERGRDQTSRAVEETSRIE